MNGSIHVRVFGKYSEPNTLRSARSAAWRIRRASSQKRQQEGQQALPYLPGCQARRDGPSLDNLQGASWISLNGFLVLLDPRGSFDHAVTTSDRNDIRVHDITGIPTGPLVERYLGALFPAESSP